MAVASLLLHLLICVTVCTRAHLPLDHYARLYDGNSYIITAEAMCGDRTEFNDYHGRVFPGFPALIALVHLTGLPFAVAAIGIDWISAAASAVLAAKLFNDRRIGWAMVFLIPHYLMNSALAMSEAPLLAFTLAGLILARDRRIAAGGACLGIACLIRPMACFALLAFVLAELAAGQKPMRVRFIRISLFCAAAVAVVLGGLVWMHHWRGSALAGLRYAAASPNTYGGDLFAWPFHALATVPNQRHEPPARVAYIWAHVVLVLGACGAMLRLLFRRPHNWDFRDALAAPWLWTNTLFILCIGNIWGFECFHRFTIPALPAMFWAIRNILPRRIVGWSILAMMSTLVAVLTLLHDLPGH